MGRRSPNHGTCQALPGSIPLCVLTGLIQHWQAPAHTHVSSKLTNVGQYALAVSGLQWGRDLARDYLTIAGCLA